MDTEHDEDSPAGGEIDFKDLVDLVFGLAVTATFEELRYFKSRMEQVILKTRGETPLRSQHKSRPKRSGRI